IWSTLRHPNILQFLGANTLDDQPFIVMPYIPNTARQFLRQYPNFDPLYILRDISLGLEYLHWRQICHGDLKGVNVLVDNANRALLCDFGLSRVKADVTSRTGLGDNSAICGSRNWMAPELFTGSQPTTRSDIYAFGMTIYEARILTNLYTDEDPFSTISSRDFVELICRQGVRPTRPSTDMVPKLTGSIWTLAETCWVEKAHNRPIAPRLHDIISHLITEVNYLDSQ
ncbi:kinase-like protein, partial [Mycena galopus ATCC 62051]